MLSVISGVTLRKWLPRQQVQQVRAGRGQVEIRIADQLQFQFDAHRQRLRGSEAF